MPAYKDLLEHDHPRIAFFKKAWKLHAWVCFGILATGGVSYYNHATGEPELVLLGSHIAVLLLGIYAGVIMASMTLIKVQLAADNPGDIW